MPYRNQQFINEEIYHTVLRALDDNLIFKDLDDYYRGIFSIYEFNNINAVSIRERREQRKKEKADQIISRDRVSGNLVNFIDKRDRFIDILAFCLMPNHIHLLLKQAKDNGITKFMQKLGAGYGGYFNRKNNRKGHVFQDRFRSVIIKDDNQLKTVVNYIHANPISLIEPNFKEQGIKNHSVKEIIDFLKKDYRWSSFQDYIGVKNFPSVTERGFILKLMGGEKGLLENMIDWVSYKKDIGEFTGLFLE